MKTFVKRLLIGLIYLMGGAVTILFMLMGGMLKMCAAGGSRRGGVMCGPGGCSMSGRRR